MINEKKMYSVSCDRCKIDAFENQESIAWESAGSAWEMAYACGWQEIRGKHYCPGCYDIDEEDELVVKVGRLRCSPNAQCYPACRPQGGMIG